MTPETLVDTSAPPSAPPVNTTDKVVIPVTGMTCASCQSHIQRALNKTPGVHDATVNLMMGNATVSYDPSVVQPDALVDTIRGTGYGAENVGIYGHSV